MLIAEGRTDRWSFSKDDHIVKPSWRLFDAATQRETFARVLSYACGVFDARINNHYRCAASSFSADTGTETDVKMVEWQTAFQSTTKPEWWPLGEHRFLPMAVLERRELLHREGFDLKILLACASTKRRKVRKDGKLARRIGRFTIYPKD